MWHYFSCNPMPLSFQWPANSTLSHCDKFVLIKFPLRDIQIHCSQMRLISRIFLELLKIPKPGHHSRHTESISSRVSWRGILIAIINRICQNELYWKIPHALVILTVLFHWSWRKIPLSKIILFLIWALTICPFGMIYGKREKKKS